MLRFSPVEFSARFRLKSSGFSRLNREFTGQFRLKSSGFSGSGFLRFNREFSGRFRLKSSGFFRFRFSPVQPGISRAVPVQMLRFFPVPVFPGSTGKYVGGSGRIRFNRRIRTRVIENIIKTYYLCGNILSI